MASQNSENTYKTNGFCNWAVPLSCVIALAASSAFFCSPRGCENASGVWRRAPCVGSLSSSVGRLASSVGRLTRVSGVGCVFAKNITKPMVFEHIQQNKPTNLEAITPHFQNTYKTNGF